MLFTPKGISIVIFFPEAPSSCSISRYLICIAALEFRRSDDSFISEAVYTLAWDVMMVASLSLFCFATAFRSASI